MFADDADTSFTGSSSPDVCQLYSHAHRSEFATPTTPPSPPLSASPCSTYGEHDCSRAEVQSVTAAGGVLRTPSCQTVNSAMTSCPPTMTSSPRKSAFHIDSLLKPSELRSPRTHFTPPLHQHRQPLIVGAEPVSAPGVLFQPHTSHPLLLAHRQSTIPSHSFTVRQSVGFQVEQIVTWTPRR